MSEATIQSGLQTAIQAMSEFASADVVINDWGILDQSTGNAPYVLIENSDDFSSEQDTQEPVTVWSIPITLIEAFTDWETSLNNLRTRRQAIIDKINSSDIRTAGGLEATNIRRIYNDGPITPVEERGMSDIEREYAVPVFLTQRIILEAEEF